MKYLLIALLMCSPVLADDAARVLNDQQRLQLEVEQRRLEQRTRDLERLQRQSRIEQQRQQIRQHGAGGCTPNFSTGGCL